MAGTLLRFTGAMRGLRISWFTVGIKPSSFLKFRVSNPGRGLFASVVPYANSGHKPRLRGLPEQKAEEAETASCMPECIVARKTNPV
jgi:hypothetical protein